MLKFNLLPGEVIRKVKFIDESQNVEHHAVFSMLKVMDYEGLLPKGYLTRVKNKQISYNTCIKMCYKLADQTKFRMESIEYKNGQLLALVERA